MDINDTGRQSNVGVLKNSAFFEAMERRMLLLPDADILPRQKDLFPKFFVGNVAFPLKIDLL